MKRTHVLSLLALACAAASGSALAQQNIGVINFTGELTNSGCTYNMTGANVSYAVDSSNNTGIGTVALSSVEVAQLAAVGDTAGDTPFTFELAGCNVTAANNSMWVNFGDGDTNVNASGRVKTAGATANVASSLSLELLDSDGTTVIVAGQPAGAGPTPSQGVTASFTGTNPAKSASKTYWVRYYAETALAATDAGPVTASVKYNVYHY